MTDNISADTQPILDYFEDPFIARPGRRNRRCHVFIFGICMTIQKFIRTNNNIEAGTVDSSKPLVIWKYLDALKKNHALKGGSDPYHGR